MFILHIILRYEPLRMYKLEKVILRNLHKILDCQSLNYLHEVAIINSKQTTKIKLMRYLLHVIFLLLVSLNIVAAQNNNYEIFEPFPQVQITNLLGLETPDSSDGFIYALSQQGQIYRIDTNTPNASPLLWFDISDRISTGGERGLLGLAFHPDFKNNGTFYVNYTAASPTRTVISKFTIQSEGLGDSDSEEILLEFNQPFSNHNGGQISFGQDGYLYIASGDGGSGGDPQGNAQNIQNLLGAMLRIDVDHADSGLNYGIPSDNPFIDFADGKDEIFAWGLRNPWRFSFDRETGVLWTGDVGQNAWEAIHIIENGLNYGWNIIEGSHCYPPGTSCDSEGLEMPVFEYDHSQGDRSITGGYVYRGSENPSLEGKYIYGDFISGRVWALDYDMENKEVISNTELINAPFNISSFGEDAQGEIYILSYNTGRIFRFEAEDGVSVHPDDELPSTFRITNAYPNPFNPTSTITFNVPEGGHVLVEVYSINGQQIATLANKPFTSGSHTITFDATGLASGVYLIRGVYNNIRQVKRVTFLK